MTTMTDLITRQAVKDWLKRWRGYLDDDMITRMQIRTIDIPPAEPKRGKWIYKDPGGWHCSLCDEQAPFWCMSSGQNLSNYCPNCGAMMEH